MPCDGVHDDDRDDAREDGGIVTVLVECRISSEIEEGMAASEEERSCDHGRRPEGNREKRENESQ